MSLLRADVAERALLAGVLIWPERGAESWRALEAEGLTYDDFEQPGPRELALAISSLVARGADVSYVDAFEAMREEGKELIGGLAGVLALQGQATAHHVRGHAAIVMRAAQRRRVRLWHLQKAEEIASNEELLAPDAWAGHLEASKAEAANFASIGQGSGNVVPALDVLRAMHVEMAESAAGIKRGVSSGFPSLDSKWTGGGMCGGWLIVVMGRPKMGKTSFALSLTREALLEREGGQRWAWRNKDNATPVLWACDEMRNQDIMSRLVADVGDLDGRAVGAPPASWMRANADAISRVSATLNESPLSFVQEQDCGRLERIFAAARTWRARHPVNEKGKKGPAMVVIDYLQRMTLAGLNKKASKEERVNEMAKACKSLARELDCVVMLLVQLNRDCERREDKRPRSSDARDSGGIEQEADTLLACYRPIVYDAAAEDVRQQAARLGSSSHLSFGERAELQTLEQRMGAAEIIVCDNRHGPRGTAYVEFRGDRFRFAPKPLDEDESGGQW